MPRSRFFSLLFAGLTFIVSLSVYLRTLAPTVPFWDGGEFIACSYILGIPHPPGSPLYVLFGRLFSLLPIGLDIGWRVNLSSALFGALAAMVVSLIIVKAVTLWRGTPQSFVENLTVHAGGLAGGLLFAFCDTQWFNCVEAEVYSLSMLIMATCTWLTLVWMERHEEPGSERYLFLIAYLTFLGIAVHMFTLLIAPAFFLLAIITDRQEIGTWKMAGLFAVMGIIMGSVVSSIDPFFVAVPLTILGLWVFRDRVAWPWFLIPLVILLLLLIIGTEGVGNYNGEPIEIGQFEISLGTFLLTLLLVTLALLLVAATSNDAARYRWNFWAAMLVVIALGYSVNFYVPIRSARHPAINENSPENWKNFEMFLERKQYGQESMLASMFTRKGSWSSQFGRGENIGFFRFFERQYTNPARGGWVFPTFLGLLGLFTLWKRERRAAVFLTVLFLICSLGLVLYMNFSDGTRGIQQEVRERDYFFTPAFLYFAVLMGIGVVQALDQIRVWLQSIPRLATPVVTGGALLALALPYMPVAAHYETHDRTGNSIPSDYAYNILQSCDKDAILFTNGDNDTFTLWFIQEVERIRRDVRVVNLSLLNTNWYIKQLKHEPPRVPITLSDEMVDRLGLQLWDDRQVDIAGISWAVPRAGSLPDGRGYLRVQDLMVLHILQTNNWKRPLYFAVTVAPENKVGLDSYLQMEGMVFRVVQQAGKDQMDLARTHHNLWNVYRYRGIADPAVYKDPQTRNLLRNYSASFQQLAVLLYRAGRIQEAITEMEKYMTLNISDSPMERSLIAQFYAESGQVEKAEKQINGLIAQDSTFGDGYMILSDLYRRQKRDDLAVAALERAVRNVPMFRQGYERLAVLYAEQNRQDRVIDILERWLRVDPTDTVIQQTVKQLKQRAVEGKP